jgi:hypothetical protein
MEKKNKFVFISFEYDFAIVDYTGHFYA